MIEDTENELIFSAASLWEITIKRSLEREGFQVDASLLRRALLDNGYAELSITSEHGVSADHLLQAQAACEGIILMTNDRKLVGLPGPTRKV